MKLEYTYKKQPSGWLIGYLNIYPEHWTQGKDLAELEVMLQDIYVIRKEEEARFAEIERQEKAKLHTGVIEIQEALV